MNLKKLKGLIVEKSISQLELAKSMGLTPQTLNRKLNGKSEFSIVEADTISKLLGISDPCKFFFS